MFELVVGILIMAIGLVGACALGLLFYYTGILDRWVRAMESSHNAELDEDEFEPPVRVEIYRWAKWRGRAIRRLNR